MDSYDVENYLKEHRRLLSVVSVIIVVICMSGVFMGIRQSKRMSENPRTSRATNELVTSTDVPIAPRYDQTADCGWLANEEWKFTLDQLPEQDIKSAVPIDAKILKRLLTDRSKRRAYDGAPPTVPHTINQTSSTSCITCHSPDSTLAISGKTPAKMSHPYLANCTQCHVPSDGLKSLTESRQDRLTIASFFKGRNIPGPGTRAYHGAPPTIPHQIWMRQNCMSCHGPDEIFAVPATHPPSQNCLQCHAPNAARDNREGILNLLPESE